MKQALLIFSKNLIYGKVKTKLDEDDFKKVQDQLLLIKEGKV